MNLFEKYERIKTPRFENKEISIDEAIDLLYDKLNLYKTSKNLYYKSSGNIGQMQNVTKLLFDKLNFAFTKGSLCDNAGGYGIKEGRNGINLNMPFSEILKSEVVVVWGRNISNTNSHLYNAIKDKTIIVIDPIKTKIAKEASLHIQLKPRHDFHLALLLCRFAFINGMEDEDFIKNYTINFNLFKNFITSYRIKQLALEGNIDLLDVVKILDLIENKKVAFLVGIGVQKYTIGDQVLRLIDSFAAMIGLFNKQGCGVNYLSDSSSGFKDPFIVKNSEQKTKVNVSFSKYDLIFIQGANPINQMPNKNRVINEIKKSKFVVYFGLYENDTSKSANLVIPSCSFLEKDDLRYSYMSEYIYPMPKIKEPQYGISEYELTKRLFLKFNFVSLKTPQEYINEIISENYYEDKDKRLKSKQFLNYKSQIDTFKKFTFIDDFEDDYEDGDGYYLITCKSKKSLNSQFLVDEFLYIHSSLGFSDGDKLKLYNEYGEYIFDVRIDDRLRSDSVLIYSGNSGVNFLTSSMLSNNGDNAIYQEIKVKLKLIKGIS